MSVRFSGAHRFGPEPPAVVKLDLAPEPLGVLWIVETAEGKVHVKQKHVQTCLATNKSVTQVFYQEWDFAESGLCARAATARWATRAAWMRSSRPN